MVKKSPANDTADEFEKLASGDKYKKAWKTARKVEAGGGGFASPVAPDGRYTARMTSARAGVTKNKELYISMAHVITEGPQTGTKVDIFQSLEPAKMEWAVKAVKSLGFEFENDEASLTDMKEIMEELNKTKPIVQLSCKNKTVDKRDQKTKKVVGKQDVCNWYIDRMLNADPPPMAKNEGGSSKADAKIEKGDAVTYELNGASSEYEVVAIDNKKGIADIKAGRKTLKAIPLGELELVFEE